MKWYAILAIIFIFFALGGIVYYGANIEKTKPNSINYQTYQKGSPYNFAWKNCAMNYDKTQGRFDPDVFVLTPILLNKNDNPAIIPFNTKYEFVFELFFENGTSQEFITSIPTHQIKAQQIYEYKNHNDISIDIVEPLGFAQKNNISEATLYSLNVSYGPSDEYGNSMMGFESITKKTPFTKFVYLTHSWTYVPLEDSVCSKFSEQRYVVMQRQQVKLES